MKKCTAEDAGSREQRGAVPGFPAIPAVILAEFFSLLLKSSPIHVK
jgi:hypothetical protein